MDFVSLIQNLDSSSEINLEQSFSLAKQCSELLRDPGKASIGRKLIISVLDNWDKVASDTQDIWMTLIEAEGFYPYLARLQNNSTSLHTAAKIRKAISRSELINHYLHDEQLTIKSLLDSNRNVILSAPTSFGKSLLIEELVAQRKYKNIVVIQPTLALLDETRKKLRKYGDYYSIVVRTSQRPSELKGNLFLLTAERVMEYTDLPSIDLLVLDEFYKLSAQRDDERSDVLNNAFHLLLHRDNMKFYLLGPNIDGISDGFAEKYNAIFYKTDYSLVEQVVESRFSKSFGVRGQKRLNKEQALFDLLLELKDEQTLIYCSSPKRARDLSRRFLLFLQAHIQESETKLSLIDWIEENIGSNWSLVECLKYKIAFHDGALQKHITSSVINYFNQHKVNFLFCTSTIIEGVNTSAKNIIVFDKHKGKQDKSHVLDFFDYSNIKGRAGRLMIHYVGKVFNFNEEFKPGGPLIVDIPFFQQNPIKDEVLIHLDETEVKYRETDQYTKLQSIPFDERSLFKQNGVLVYGQKRILDYLREVLPNKIDSFTWQNYPTYKQLKMVLDLAWDNLLKPGETTFPMNKGNLSRVTFNYARSQDIFWLVRDSLENLNTEQLWAIENDRNVDPSRYDRAKPLLKMDEVEILDEAIRSSFNILRHWFQYKVPKWLRTIHTLQEYVCIEKNLKSGNYLLYADKIESDFVRENLSILLEYGIPKSAITKLEKHINSDLGESQVIELTKSENLFTSAELSEYERECINQSL